MRNIARVQAPFLFNQSNNYEAYHFRINVHLDLFIFAIMHRCISWPKNRAESAMEKFKLTQKNTKQTHKIQIGRNVQCRIAFRYCFRYYYFYEIVFFIIIIPFKQIFQCCTHPSVMFLKRLITLYKTRQSL